jgi:hypothetical protein
MPRPDQIDFQLSKIVLGTTISPGVVKLTGHDRKEKWDIKDAKGQDGASTSLQGKPIGQFSASFYLVDDGSPGTNDFDDWDSFQRLIESTTNGPKPQALDIYHPDLARNGFTSVVMSSISGMQYDGSTVHRNPSRPRKHNPRRAGRRKLTPTRTKARASPLPRRTRTRKRKRN